MTLAVAGWAEQRALNDGSFSDHQLLVANPTKSRLPSNPGCPFNLGPGKSPPSPESQFPLP